MNCANVCDLAIPSNAMEAKIERMKGSLRKKEKKR